MSPRTIATEAKLLLIGIPVFLWTVLPVYHMFLFAISPKESAFAGNLWPDHPTLNNFAIVLQEKHYYLNHFWRQMGNSLVIAVATGAITLVVATFAAFAISRLRIRGGRLVMNLALFSSPPHSWRCRCIAPWGSMGSSTASGRSSSPW